MSILKGEVQPMIDFTPAGSNEVHNLIIKNIEDRSWMDNPYVILGCTGYILREIGGKREVDKIRYSCTVKVLGDLMGYAVNELAIGDKIFVIGHSDMTVLNGRYKVRITVADQIFKSDWLHYYNRM